MELLCRSSGQLGQHISQISPEVDPELLTACGEANNEMLLLIFHALGNKTEMDCPLSWNPWWYLANVILFWGFVLSTLLGLPRVIENSKANMSCKKGFYRPVTHFKQYPKDSDLGKAEVTAKRIKKKLWRANAYFWWGALLGSVIWGYLSDINQLHRNVIKW